MGRGDAYYKAWCFPGFKKGKVEPRAGVSEQIPCSFRSGALISTVDTVCLAKFEGIKVKI